MRSRLDFSALDHIGHGIKVTDSTSGITKRYTNTAIEVSTVRERESVCVCVCVCVLSLIWMGALFISVLIAA